MTVAPELSPEVYEAQFDAMLERPDTYYVLCFVHTETGKIVASASLIVERKFLRNAGMVGHVEDVVVDPECKGQSLGKIMIQGLSELGMQRGCYKVILDCDAKNAGEPLRENVATCAGLTVPLDWQAFTRSADTATSGLRWLSTSNRALERESLCVRSNAGITVHDYWIDASSGMDIFLCRPFVLNLDTFSRM